MVLATYDSGLYKFCLVLHILCAIVGFGAVFLNGLYGAADEGAHAVGQSRPRRSAIYEANETVSKIGEYFIYAVFLLRLRGARPQRLGVEVLPDLGVAVGAIYIVAIGLSHGVLLPAVKRMGVLMREMAAGPPPRRRATAAGRGDGSDRPEARRRRTDPRPLHDRRPLPDGVEARRLKRRRQVAPYDDRVHPVLGSFYDEVLRELIAAMGAALFFGNLYALLRRHKRRRPDLGAHGRTRPPGKPGALAGQAVGRASSRRHRSGGPSGSSCSASW